MTLHETLLSFVVSRFRRSRYVRLRGPRLLSTSVIPGSTTVKHFLRVYAIYVYISCLNITPQGVKRGLAENRQAEPAQHLLIEIGN